MIGQDGSVIIDHEAEALHYAKLYYSQVYEDVEFLKWSIGGREVFVAGIAIYHFLTDESVDPFLSQNTTRSKTSALDDYVIVIGELPDYYLVHFSARIEISINEDQTKLENGRCNIELPLASLYGYEYKVSKEEHSILNAHRLRP